jgi:UDP-N-acetylglucosamine 4,6-dehydratase
MRENGVLPITDQRMTRFWITLEQGVEFVIKAIERMHGGEIFVPKIPSMNIMDLARAIAPECRCEFVGIRPGEKLHEIMVPEDDARRTLEFDSYFVIQPEHNFWSVQDTNHLHGVVCPEGFKYSSETNDLWLSVDDLRKMIGQGVEVGG